MAEHAPWRALGLGNVGTRTPRGPRRHPLGRGTCASPSGPLPLLRSPSQLPALPGDRLHQEASWTCSATCFSRHTAAPAPNRGSRLSSLPRAGTVHRIVSVQAETGPGDRVPRQAEPLSFIHSFTHSLTHVAPRVPLWAENDPGGSPAVPIAGSNGQSAQEVGYVGPMQ